MSQQPDLFLLQQRLYEQLSEDSNMPASAKSVEKQVAELQKICAGRVFLVVLDDMVILSVLVLTFCCLLCIEMGLDFTVYPLSVLCCFKVGQQTRARVFVH